MSSPGTHYVKVGDTSTWTLTVLEGTSGKDLTDATSVAVYMRRQGSSTLTISGGSGTKDGDQSTYPGRFTFTPTAQQVGTPGVYQLEVKVTWSGGAVSKYPSIDYSKVHITDAMS